MAASLEAKKEAERGSRKQHPCPPGRRCNFQDSFMESCFHDDTHGRRRAKGSHR